MKKELIEESDSLKQAKIKLEQIVEMVKTLRKAGNLDGGQEAEKERDRARTQIHESVLSVEVRTDWHELGADDLKPTHYKLLLCWGGPAVQIFGELTEPGEVETAELQHQDWGTPWTSVNLWYEFGGDAENLRAALLEFASQFYFGE